VVAKTAKKVAKAAKVVSKAATLRFKKKNQDVKLIRHTKKITK